MRSIRRSAAVVGCVPKRQQRARDPLGFCLTTLPSDQATYLARLYSALLDVRVIFDSPAEQAAPGDDVTFGFFVESPDDQRSCSYRLEQTGLGASLSLWRVDGPTTLTAGEPGRGALTVRAPDNPGT
jgi:hypothetical protein